MPLEIDRTKIEAPFETTWWGQKCTCDPRFVEAILGDGTVLLALQPLNTRPHYYLIRVDSSWHLHNCNACTERCPDELTEHLDEIYDAIEDEYGDRERTEESNRDLLEEDPKAEPDPTDWPVFDDSSGTCWWVREAESYAPSVSATQEPTK